jgi:hypothetical protein
MVEIFDSVALISALYDSLYIGKTIDEMVKWDPIRCRSFQMAMP